MTDWQRPNVEAPLIVWEYAQALERHCDALAAQVETLREALRYLAEWDETKAAVLGSPDFRLIALAALEGAKP